jgi:hypothetical protein
MSEQEYTPEEEMSDVYPDPNSEVFQNVGQQIHAYCNQIMEHTDAETVQIFITKYVPENASTANYTYGLGNWFARKGQIQDWVDRVAAVSQDEAINTQWDEIIDDDFEDDEDLV